jgi:hypothetical protein
MVTYENWVFDFFIIMVMNHKNHPNTWQGFGAISNI